MNWWFKMSDFGPRGTPSWATAENGETMLGATAEVLAGTSSRAPTGNADGVRVVP